MNVPLEIAIETLTPLWTGGVDGKSDRLHMTGIIGSLRWWFEAVVRGMGGYACDPVEHSCIYDPSAPNDGLCVSCRLFGATGWRRRFRLIVEDQTSSGGPYGTLKPTGDRYKRDGKTPPSWYFNGGRTGGARLKILPTGVGLDPIVVHGVLTLIERQASLAAKPQLGYGLIEIKSEVPLDKEKFVSLFQSLAATYPSANAAVCPSLDKMFFAALNVLDHGVTASLNIRYDLRKAFRDNFNNNRTLRHWVCGSVSGNERQASKISVSQAVDGVIRVWGWIPESVPVDGVDRDAVMTQIHSTIQSSGTLVHWREFDCARDTVSRYTSMDDYLLSLLEAPA